MTIEVWLADACADADRRGLAELKPLLSALADATRALRSTDWDSAARLAGRAPGIGDGPHGPSQAACGHAVDGERGPRAGEGAA